MKVFGCLLLVAGFAGAQLKVPDEGWKLLEKGEGKTEGKSALGVWQNEEKTVIVGASRDEKLPGSATLYGLDLRQDPGLYDPDHLPDKVELLEKPRVGVKIMFLANDEERTGRLEHYWVYGKKGGVLFKVSLKGEAKFSLEDWTVDGKVEDHDGEKHKELEAFVKKSVGLFPPTIRLNAELSRERAMRAKADEVKIEVVVRKDGGFEFGGKALDEEALRKVLKKEGAKNGEKGVLHVKAEKEVEFKYVLRVIKAAAAAGVTKVAYASFAKDEKEERDGKK